MTIKKTERDLESAYEVRRDSGIEDPDSETNSGLLSHGLE